MGGFIAPFYQSWVTTLSYDRAIPVVPSDQKGTGGVEINRQAWAFLNFRYETLTVLAPTCKSSEAFSQAGEGVLFCPTLWTADAPLERGRFLTMG